MAKRYMIFIDEEQVRILQTEMGAVLEQAIATKRAELIIPLAGLVNQLKNPRELKDRQRGFLTLFKDQVLGK